MCFGDYSIYHRVIRTEVKPPICSTPVLNHSFVEWTTHGDAFWHSRVYGSADIAITVHHAIEYTVEHESVFWRTLASKISHYPCGLT